MPAKPAYLITRVCCFLLFMQGTASLQAQEVSAPNVLDIEKFSFPPEIKAVRLIELEFSVVKENEDDWEDADTLFDNDDDTIYKDVGDYIHEPELDTLYDPQTISQFYIDPTGHKTAYTSVYLIDTSWTDAEGISYKQSEGDGSDELITTAYNKDGTVKSELFESYKYGKRLREYTYDKKKRLIKTEITAAQSRSVEKWAYDKKGRCIYHVDSVARKGKEMAMSYQFTFEYNKKGQLARKIRLRSAVAVHSNHDEVDTTTYEYDEQGRISRTIETGSPGKKCNTYVYSYTGQGLLSRITYEYRAQYTSVITGEIVFEYDEHNQCTSKVETSHIGKGAGPYNDQQHWLTTYNEKGLPVRCVYTYTFALAHTSTDKVRIFTWEYEYR